MKETYSRKKIVEKAIPLIPKFENIFDSIRKKYTVFQVYYCFHVQDLINIMIKFGKTKDIGLQYISRIINLESIFLDTSI